jgi:hypothetical protein
MTPGLVSSLREASPAHVYAPAMQPVLVVLSLVWFALVVTATYRMHVLTRVREFMPPRRAGGVRSVFIAWIIWGVAFNIGWVPVMVAVSV